MTNSIDTAEIATWTTRAVGLLQPLCPKTAARIQELAGAGLERRVLDLQAGGAAEELFDAEIGTFARDESEAAAALQSRACDAYFGLHGALQRALWASRSTGTAGDVREARSFAARLQG